jgi:S-adenosylmethionine hydrolase
MNTIITLTTDFGLHDEYVGVMKGVILSLAPSVRIVDLTHSIGSQALPEAAYCIASAYSYFPKGTVHVVVVDPGVGSNRKILALCADGHLFIAPDNGVLSLLFNHHFEAAYEITNRELFRQPVSATFHGRDIMAPVAARLVQGFSPAAVGPAMIPSDLSKLPLPTATVDHAQKTITGQVISIDKFGNLITNIHIDNELLRTVAGQYSQLLVSVCGLVIIGIQASYASVAPKSPLAVIGSRNTLEIAVNMGNAAEMLRAAPGDMVTVSLAHTAPAG